MNLRTSLVIVAALAAGTAFAQQQDFSKVEIKTAKVAGNVSMLTGAGGNIGVSSGPDGILIVDDQFAPLAPKIEKAISALSPKPVRFILNTHWHGDHTGGNEALGKLAPIIAHKNVRLRLEKGATMFGHTIPPAPEAALPVITYDDGISIFLNGEEVRVQHLEQPAHTDGDSIVIFTKSKVIHFGDQFTNKTFPFIDTSSGGNVRGYIANLEKLRPQLTPDMKLIPGHGPMGTVADLDGFIAMLKDTTGRVEKGIAAGKTLEQLKQEDVLKGYESWQSDFVNKATFTELIFNSLKAPSAAAPTAPTAVPASTKK